jgi:hypothetical protein
VAVGEPLLVAKVGIETDGQGFGELARRLDEHRDGAIGSRGALEVGVFPGKMFAD